MSLCPACSGAVSDSAQVCPRCGTPTPWAATMILDAAETVAVDESDPAGSPARPPSSRPAWMSPSDAIDHGRFAPGDLVAERYRIIGRLGKGGMGEVFRADDLRLGQPVALKFLPGTLERDPMKLAQFHAEVRFARQVSHPNVCRVYDIGEADGVPFISMEYVDGEDLASLVRRIGRLPQDKGLDIARQLCAGLAAAHERGVLHRDLKPANVMLDSVGKVRLTDFGLAAVVGTVDAARAGTPAFMSPEQLAGREVDARSDIFSLGLVLYEVFTGHRAFDAPSIGELMRRHEGVIVTRPTELVPELDPLIEQGVLRCLAYDPADRPATALAVAASLPGGDPLAAALAAGETPSPEMVAAAGETAAMPRSRALLWFAGLAALVVATALESAAGGVLAHLPSPKPPAVLLDRAQALLAAAGYTGMARGTASGFEPNTGRRGYVRKKDEALGRRVAAGDRPDSFAFFYRTSPLPLRPMDPAGNVTSSDPPLDTTGMTLVRMDPEGRLLSFTAVPPQVAHEEAPQPIDWAAFFRAADIDPKNVVPGASTWTPSTYADTRYAWTGEWPDRPGTPLRIEAASYSGRPVSFLLIGPWTRPSRDRAPDTSGRRSFAGAFIALALVALIVAAVLVSRMNLKAGRGDRAGALRIGWAIGLSQMAGWLLSSTHVADPTVELVRFFAALGQALVFAAVVWMLYIALEPWVRRFWPDSLKGWTRLLAGHVSDPRVGRDVMIGLAFGLGLQLVVRLSIPLHDMLGQAGPPPMLGRIELLAGPMYALGQLAVLVSGATFNAFAIVFLIVGLKGGLRRMPLVVVVTIALYVILTVPERMAEGTPWIGASLGVLAIVAIVTVTVRYGLLATNVAFFASYIASAVPFSLALGEWQAQPTMLACLVLLALAAWGSWTAAGGRLRAS